MPKKPKQLFATHDFEFARELFEAMGRDLHMDLLKTIKGIQEDQTPISNEAVFKHSPWINEIRRRAAESFTQPNDAGLREQLKVVVWEVQRWVLFYGHGEQNFRLWPSLCEALLATEFKCPRELLKVPYNSFTFHLPKVVGELLPICHEDGTDWAGCTVYVNAALSEVTEQACLEIQIISEQPKSAAAVLTAQDTDKRNVYNFVLDLSNAPDVLDEEWMHSHDLSAGDSGLERRQDVEYLRLILNAILYVSTPAADLIRRTSEFDDHVVRMKKHPKNKQRQLKQRALVLRQSSMIRHSDVGKKLKLSSLSMDGNQGDHGVYKLNHKFLVRGHWRNQAFGPGREGHKLIWIKPHYKGTGLPERKGRTYEVSE